MPNCAFCRWAGAPVALTFGMIAAAGAAAAAPLPAHIPEASAPAYVVTAGPAKSILDDLGPAEATSPPAGNAAAPAADDAAHDIPEPDDYRQDHYRSPVPKTLKGARVISTPEAEEIFAEGKAVFIDVYPRAPKPPNLPAGTIWRDLPHTTIKGGHWLPNVGFGALPPEDEAYLIAELESLTGGDKTRPLVFYCLRDCWMSWNTAKRVMGMGYRDVIWFPDGTDGWQEAGNETASVQPDAK